MDVAAVLGDEAEVLLEHTCSCIPADHIEVPGPDHLDCSDGNPSTRSSLHRLYDSGRLAGTGYLSLLPVDHGIAHTAGMVFAPNPLIWIPGRWWN